MALAFFFAAGALAGALHVVSGVDHLAALLPLVVGRRARAFALGARWGVGHSAGVLVVALVALALRSRLDLELVSVWGERLVAVMLVALGLWAGRRALRLEVHAHSHGHDDAGDHVHVHAHPHGGDHAHEALDRHHGHAALAAGTLHGVAGGAHLFGVLPALALPDAVSAAAYLVGFALATVLSMGAFALLVGEGSARWAAGGRRRLRLAALGASAATIAVGVGWLLVSTPVPAP
jgi:ABC-type nickel/cobalt efflux system permease component RcnA